MEVREATEEDIPAIVNLLKLSLGESRMPKSEKYWRWKHLENPFGPSPVLVCHEGHTLVGVRAFMRWEWMHKGQLYRAVRAVDTATHPDFQGKGIFKNLTLSLVDSCTKAGDQFVFNTPNKKSEPGYVKMGWVGAGRLPVRMLVRRPFSIVTTQFNGIRNVSDFKDPGLAYWLHHADLESFSKDYLEQQNAVTTHVSVAYLNWRYQAVPVANYAAVGTELGSGITGLVIGRIKNTRLGREFRITDYFWKENNNIKELKQKLNTCMKERNIDYVTVSGALTGSAKKVFGGFMLPSLAGPMVTVRALAMSDLTNLKNFNLWSPSLGDLELF